MENILKASEVHIWILSFQPLNDLEFQIEDKFYVKNKKSCYFLKKLDFLPSGYLGILALPFYPTALKYFYEGAH